MTFDLARCLEQAGFRRNVVHLKPKQILFFQGSPAKSVFYLQTGSSRLTTVSQCGKAATIALIGPGEFIGEESLASAGGFHSCTATANSACTAVRIAREDMISAIHVEHSISEMFLNFLLARSTRFEANLVDQLFNSSEKRLARILLLLSESGEPDKPQSIISPITQQTLAEIVGTTRSRVSFFMNRFRRLGLIEYDDLIRVHRTRLNEFLHDDSIALELRENRWRKIGLGAKAVTVLFASVLTSPVDLLGVIVELSTTCWISA